ncbi:TetR/AcrR family transcriptional regulator [Rhizorhabdus wittichii]|uniref:TetR/AcrR family transcriptional regulator n=1 Tax=Rhizorhabdus wittichii TaxID=160791 RepID=UPI0002E1137D|nr:TetR family transcriptional regulator [Rhizorhabdus wittichii]
MNADPYPSPARQAGRPRRLTLDRLLDTAIELGLADLNMKELAAHLGVGIATLYRYVENRDALIRLAAGRQATRSAPVDSGQPWREIVLDYAAALFSSVGQQPSLIIEFVEARWGIAVELEFVDGFLGALERRGFAPDEAMALYRAMAKILLGAAVAAGHFAALAARGTTQARELRQALGSFEADELPHLRAAADDYADEVAATAWRPILDAVLDAMEARRG